MSCPKNNNHNHNNQKQHNHDNYEIIEERIGLCLNLRHRWLMNHSYNLKKFDKRKSYLKNSKKKTNPDSTIKLINTITITCPGGS